MAFENELLSMNRTSLLNTIIDDIVHYDFPTKKNTSRANNAAVFSKIERIAFSKNLVDLRKRIKVLSGDPSIRSAFADRLRFFDFVIKRKLRGPVVNRVMRFFGK